MSVPFLAMPSHMSDLPMRLPSPDEHRHMSNEDSQPFQGNKSKPVLIDLSPNLLSTVQVSYPSFSHPDMSLIYDSQEALIQLAQLVAQEESLRHVLQPASADYLRQNPVAYQLWLNRMAIENYDVSQVAENRFAPFLPPQHNADWPLTNPSSKLMRSDVSFALGTQPSDALFPSDSNLYLDSGYDPRDAISMTTRLPTYGGLPAEPTYFSAPSKHSAFLPQPQVGMAAEKGAQLAMPGAWNALHNKVGLQAQGTMAAAGVSALKLLPTAVHEHVLLLCQAHPIIKVADFDGKVVEKMLKIISEFGVPACMSMLEILHQRLVTKVSRMKNGRGYLDVVVRNHLTLLRDQPAGANFLSNYEMAERSLSTQVFSALKVAVATNAVLSMDYCDMVAVAANAVLSLDYCDMVAVAANAVLSLDYSDMGIIQIIKRLSVQDALMKLKSLSSHSFKHASNVQGCLASFLNAKIDVK
eukprot:gene24737-10374_t